MAWMAARTGGRAGGRVVGGANERAGSARGACAQYAREASDRDRAASTRCGASEAAGSTHAVSLVFILSDVNPHCMADE